MKKIIGIFLTIAVLTCLLGTMSFANDNIIVKLDDKELVFDQNPVIVNGRTMVPLRVIFESLGATIEWDGATQTVTATKGDIKVIVQVNNNIMLKNQEQITLDVAPQIIGSRTLVPARAISESFNCNVAWDGDISLVKITTESYAAADTAAINVYAADGRVKVIKASDAEIYARYGWNEKTFTMYAADGRTIEVKESEVEAYGQVGWFMSEEEAANGGQGPGPDGQEPQEPEEPEPPAEGSGPMGEKPEKPSRPPRP